MSDPILGEPYPGGPPDERVPVVPLYSGPWGQGSVEGEPPIPPVPPPPLPPPPPPPPSVGTCASAADLAIEDYFSAPLAGAVRYGRPLGSYKPENGTVEVPYGWSDEKTDPDPDYVYLRPTPATYRGIVGTDWERPGQSMSPWLCIVGGDYEIRTQFAVLSSGPATTNFGVTVFLHDAFAGDGALQRVRVGVSRGIGVIGGGIARTTRVYVEYRDLDSPGAVWFSTTLGVPVEDPAGEIVDVSMKITATGVKVDLNRQRRGDYPPFIESVTLPGRWAPAGFRAQLNNGPVGTNSSAITYLGVRGADGDWRPVNPPPAPPSDKVGNGTFGAVAGGALATLTHAGGYSGPVQLATFSPATGAQYARRALIPRGRAVSLGSYGSDVYVGYVDDAARGVVARYPIDRGVAIQNPTAAYAMSDLLWDSLVRSDAVWVARGSGSVEKLSHSLTPLAQVNGGASIGAHALTEYAGRIVALCTTDVKIIDPATLAVTVAPVPAFGNGDYRDIAVGPAGYYLSGPAGLALFSPVGALVRRRTDIAPTGYAVWPSRVHLHAGYVLAEGGLDEAGTAWVLDPNSLATVEMHTAPMGIRSYIPYSGNRALTVYLSSYPGGGRPSDAANALTYVRAETVPRTLPPPPPPAPSPTPIPPPAPVPPPPPAPVPPPAGPLELVGKWDRVAPTSYDSTGPYEFAKNYYGAERIASGTGPFTVSHVSGDLPPGPGLSWGTMEYGGYLYAGLRIDNATLVSSSGNYTSNARYAGTWKVADANGNEVVKTYEFFYQPTPRVVSWTINSGTITEPNWAGGTLRADGVKASQELDISIRVAGGTPGYRVARNAEVGAQFGDLKVEVTQDIPYGAVIRLRGIPKFGGADPYYGRWSAWYDALDNRMGWSGRARLILKLNLSFAP